MSKKATNLAALARHGVQVPQGFYIDASHYCEAVAPRRDELMLAATDTAEAHRFFGSLALPERTARALQDGLSSLSTAGPFAVRSSGNVAVRGRQIMEDGSEASLAGQFESFLCVPRENIVDAVRLCWASLFNERSIHMFAVDADYVEHSSMTVLIQEMIPAAASAVVMTVDPLGDGSTGGIELSLGPCEAIVSGAVSPDEVVFSRATGEILERRIGAKEIVIEYEPFSRRVANALRRTTPQAAREQLAVSENVLTEMVTLARRIERIFGVPQDLELVVTDRESIVVVQARPITRLPSTFHANGPVYTSD